jgi:adenylate cyclase
VLPWDHVGTSTWKRLKSSRRALWAGVAACVAAIAILLWTHLGERLSRPAPGSGVARLAVLPLANYSPDPSDEYLADGMTEELISRLSKIPQLNVIARTSVMQYKGKHKSVSDIGRELNVGSVLEGSVRKAGNKVRITVQLIDANNQSHIWTQDYESYDQTVCK